MKKEFFQEIEIPAGIEANINGNMFSVKGPEGELSREFNLNKIEFEKKGNKIVIGAKKATKREKKMINTITSHIKNMTAGVQKQFEYQLKVCFSHFPITVEVSDKGAIVKNFLGEKIPRKVKFEEGVDVKIEKDLITITSINKEKAGQTAANFETATKVSARDRRVFQDGIFMINKAGKEI
jgi:large subunit ribosomal protein L6